MCRDEWCTHLVQLLAYQRLCLIVETLDENNLAREVAVTVEDESDVDKEFDLSPPSTKIKSHREAIQSLEDIQKVEAVLGADTNASAWIDQVASQHVSSLTQTKSVHVVLYDYVCCFFCP